MIEENIPLTEETKKEITIEDKNRIKNQIKEQYKNMNNENLLLLSSIIVLYIMILFYE